MSMHSCRFVTGQGKWCLCFVHRCDNPSKAGYTSWILAFLSQQGEREYGKLYCAIDSSGIVASFLVPQAREWSIPSPGGFVGPGIKSDRRTSFVILLVYHLYYPSSESSLCYPDSLAILHPYRFLGTHTFTGSSATMRIHPLKEFTRSETNQIETDAPQSFISFPLSLFAVLPLSSPSPVVRHRLKPFRFLSQCTLICSRLQHFDQLVFDLIFTAKLEAFQAPNNVSVKVFCS